jgi:hypothetical protein
MTNSALISNQFKQILSQELSKENAAEIKDIAFRRPVIIGGCGSSGTSLLRKMFDAHRNFACGPEISLFDRPQFFKTDINELYEIFLKQKVDALERDLIYPIVTQFGSYCGLFVANAGKNYHNLATIKELFEMSSNTKHFVNLFFSNFAAQQGKIRWAEKTPNNVFCIRESLKFFPDAKFIHVIRDGRDVVLSLMEKRNFNPLSAIFRWLAAVEAGLRYRGNPRYYEVRYEDLVTDPESTLTDMMGFLDEEFDPDMMDYWKKGDVNPHGYGTTPVFTKSIGKWKKVDPNSLIMQQLDLMLRDKLEKLGYDTDEKTKTGI